jgi:hypothetical protein
MNRNSTRTKWGAYAVGALTAAVLAVSTTPAAADGSSGLAFVYGAGVFEDDWNNEGVVDIDTNKISNATCLWQKILWADGHLSSTADIDGDFGSQTRAATASWQDRFNLGVDGSAGAQTWTKAGTWLYYISGSEQSGQTLTLGYNGSSRDFTMTRNADGNYHFWDSSGVKRAAGYNYRTCA